MMRILIVEDELRIATDICDAVTAGGYVAEIASGGEDAWFRGSTGNYSAIVLDLGLPDLDGLTILKRWRQEGIATPVIVLTARGTWAERVDGIDAGADDYLPKPFRMEELMARLRALLRRSTGQVQPIITIGPVSLDPRTQQVSVNSIPVSLTPLEYRLISYLFHNQGRVVSQTELGEALYSHDNERDSNAIEALVGRLRKKIKAKIIDTRRGFGYIVTAHGP
jgi:DNA-binding response OmpR family regulator